MTRATILSGAGYAAGVLISELNTHPEVMLHAVYSRSHAGDPIYSAHPHLKGVVNASFTHSIGEAMDKADCVFVAAGHGDGMLLVEQVLRAGFDGPIVDLSADFRLTNSEAYKTWYGLDHVLPEILEQAWYGLPEITGSPATGTQIVANPGCFATAIALALFPVSQKNDIASASVVALTGASGAGITPRSTTHFPNRDGNVRAYNVLRHRHQSEVENIIGSALTFSFVPVSGPWTNGIWGTATMSVSPATSISDITELFEECYGSQSLIRLSPGILPEMSHVTNTPFCDLGWTVDRETLVVGFAIDNLMKGAATQAIQNMNLLLGLPGNCGLIQERHDEVMA